MREPRSTGDTGSIRTASMRCWRRWATPRRLRRRSSGEVLSGSVDVSVLVPVLNEEAELEQAARAMLSQELDGVAEFIFIDGGSVDASPRILRDLDAHN